MEGGSPLSGGPLRMRLPSPTRGAAVWGAAALVGTQAGWALQSALATPLLLRLGEAAPALAWLRLPGPAAGLVVQPAVGLVSDRLGRRRPFLALGAWLAALGLAAMAVAEGRGSVGTCFAGLWLLDIGFNAADTSARALLADAGGPAHTARLQAAVAGALSLGQVLGFSFAAFSGAGSSSGGNGGASASTASCAPALWAGATLTVATLALALAYGPADARPKTAGSAPKSRPRGLSGGGRGGDDAGSDAPLLNGGPSASIETLGEPPALPKDPSSNVSAGPGAGDWRPRAPPPWMVRLCAVNGVLWAGWFFLLLFAAHWVGTEVCGGDPHAPAGSLAAEAYDEGVRWASGGLVGAAVVALGAAAAVEPAARLVGGSLERTHALGGGALLGACMVGALSVRPGQRVAAATVLAATGVPWAVTQSAPYAIVAARAGPDERGQLLGVLNIFIVLPQMADLLLIRLAGAPVRALLVAGAGCAFAAAALGVTMPVPGGDTLARRPRRAARGAPREEDVVERAEARA